MSKHIKRGAELHVDRDTSTEWGGIDDGRINSEWQCNDCGGNIKAKQRRGLDAYISLECDCGAASLDLRIADILDFEVDAWDTVTIANTE
jgi:hypothetical protein